MKQLTRTLYYLGLSLLAVCILPLPATASHIRAGEITARRLNAQGFTYEITLRGYSDRNSQVIFGSNGTLDFGDGTSRILTNTNDPNSANYITRTAVCEDTWMYELKVTHTFPTARAYTISFREFYRNEGILNMDNSVNMPFYLETVIIIDPFLGANSTPVLTKPPVDRAIVRKTYHHQPEAFDLDGDSLSYQLVVSRQDKNTAVTFYRFPDKTFGIENTMNGLSEAGSTPYFIINPTSGDIVWDAPGTIGEYTVALKVEEWRKVKGKYYTMGYVIRDMQIIVEEEDQNLIPRLTYPFEGERVAPAAGESTKWTITAHAPTASDSVVLELWGDFLNHTEAIVSSTRVKAKGEASITIQWTGQEDIGQHYQLIARSYYPDKPQYTRNRTTFFYYSPAKRPLGVSEVDSSPLQIFPNPAAGGSFYISLPEASGRKVFLQVYDLKGQLIRGEAGISMQDVHAVELQEAKQGTYLLLLHYNGRIYRNKLIVP